MLVVVITILTTLTTLTTTIEVYAGGGDDGNDGDGNKNKAEHDSAAAIADCDENDVEVARFLCIAIATNEVELETPEEEPPEEESATLSVCKEVTPNLSAEDFDFTVTGNNPSPAQFTGDENCVDVTIGPGEYTVSETSEVTNFATDITGNCVPDPNDINPQRATGEIQSGETQECIFDNFSD
jgi:hypothetical protein